MQYKFAKVAKTINEDDRTVVACISDDSVDRDNEIVNQNGIKTENFQSNPLVLFNHDHDQIPIGTVTDLKTDDGKTYATIKFATSDANPKAEQIFQSVKQGILNNLSIGFNTIESHTNNEGVKVLDEIDLVEISVVNAGANPRTGFKSSNSKCYACDKQIPSEGVCDVNCESQLKEDIKAYINEKHKKLV